MQMVDKPSDSIVRDPNAATLAGWSALLDEHGALHGYHRRLDAGHGAIFTEDDDVLLVSFETGPAMRSGPVGLPAALGVAGREGWSQLCLYSEGNTFFRSQAVFDYFDELVDEGFFDRFDRVVFYGAGSCGYAAAAFSVTAPFSTVVLLHPVATLDSSRAEWDRRFPGALRSNFTDRYGYAPDMIEAAENVFVIYDPEIREDAMHAALFGLPDQSLLRCRRLGASPEKDLEKMGVLTPLLQAAGRGKLERRTFMELYRKRRRYRPYLHRVLNRLRVEQRVGLSRHWANGVREQLSLAPKARARN